MHSVTYNQDRPALKQPQMLACNFDILNFNMKIRNLHLCIQLYEKHGNWDYFKKKKKKKNT